MKFPRAINLPARGSGQLTPALACLALALLLALQLALPQRTEVASATGRAPRVLRDPVATMVPPYPPIFRAPIFAPLRAAGGGAPPAEGEAGGTFAALGVGLGQGAATAILRTPGGEVVRVRPGQVVAGWRVQAIQATRVVLVQGGRRAVLVVGAQAADDIGARMRAMTGADDGNDATADEDSE